MDWDFAGRDGVLDRPRGLALRLHRRGDVGERHPDGQANLLVRSSALMNGTEVKRLHFFSIISSLLCKYIALKEEEKKNLLKTLLFCISADSGEIFVISTICVLY